MRKLSLAVLFAAFVAAFLTTSNGTAAADAMVEGTHRLAHEYVLTGTTAHEGYTFLLIGSIVSPKERQDFEVRVLRENEPFAPFRWHWSREINTWLVAVKGEVPATITHDFLDGASKAFLDGNRIFTDGAFVEDTNPAYKIRTTFRVEMVLPEQEDGEGTIKLTQTRKITYGQNGDVISDVEGAGNGAGNRENDGPRTPDGPRESDGDGLPFENEPVPATPAPWGLLIALAAVAAAGLLVGLRAVAGRE